VFTFHMILTDGTPADPPQFVSSEPNWKAGDHILIRPGQELRILGIDQAKDVDAVWTVEPVPNGH
jgi:hypothetical protein